jgi:outer membrane protein assembly factor BamB/orotate phosphoribosyltransferase
MIKFGYEQQRSKKSPADRSNPGPHPHSTDLAIISSAGMNQPWIFDFKGILLKPDFLALAAAAFWETCAKRYPFQVGGLESASLPLLGAICMKGIERGTPINGFYIRKSRKPDGLQKSIEGTLTKDPIILIDDLMNSGGTFLKQMEILKKEGRKPVTLFSFVRLRPLEAYSFAKEAGAEIVSLFSLQDFDVEFPPKERASSDTFEIKWSVDFPGASYFYRVPKSSPAFDSKRVYFGTDDGTMRAHTQGDGSEVWKFRIYGPGIHKKTIFSTPAIHEKTLFFGAYDGNFYALDTETGKKKWVYMDADWIGSSPAIAPDFGLIYVGLEYGLWNKKGGIVALDMRTGGKKWEYISMPHYTHASPSYSSKYHAVGIGSNDGVFYLFGANDGDLKWKLQTKGEIKASCAFDEKRGYVIFGSHDGKMYIVNLRDGKILSTLSTGAWIFSTPLVVGDRVYVTSLDKKVYCVNLDTFDIEWSFTASGRIFSSPLLVGDYLYVGSNDGRFYEIEATSGKNTAFLQVAERITNKAAYNPATKRFFIRTYGNELLCIMKKNR